MPDNENESGSSSDRQRITPLPVKLRRQVQAQVKLNYPFLLVVVACLAVASLLFAGSDLKLGAFRLLSFIALMGVIWWLIQKRARLSLMLWALIKPNPADDPLHRQAPPRLWTRRWTLWLALVALALFRFAPFPALIKTIGEATAVLSAAAWLAVHTRSAIAPFRMPLIMVFGYYMMLNSDQGLEAIRTTNESFLLFRILVYCIWLVLCLFLSMTLIAMARRSTTGEGTQPSYKMLMALLGSGPFLVVILTSWASLEAVTGSIFPRIDGVVLYCQIVSLSFILLIAAPTIWGSRVPDPLGFQDEGLSSLGQLLTAFALFFLCNMGLVWLAHGINYPLELPPILFLAGWIGLITTIFFYVGKAGRLIGIPASSLLILWGVLLSAFNLNDNHELSFALTNNKPFLASDAFAAWLNTRSGHPRSVTVFVVDSEGGGARAAYVTTVALEALRTRCSPFNQEHFATIGVSGGSLGAALSAGEVNPPPSSSDCSDIGRFDSTISPAVRAAAVDLLGPALRGLLLADLPMRLFPSSLWRSGGIGDPKALNQNWTTLLGDQSTYMEDQLRIVAFQTGQHTFLDRIHRILDMSGPKIAPSLKDPLFSDAWPGPTGDRPALILLATDVASGRRIAFSHLRFGPPPNLEQPACRSQADDSWSEQDRARLLTFSDVAPGRDPTLLGAALTSARFPIVSAPATLPCPGAPWRLVDGGYFENSGLTTALELMDAMAAGAKAAGFSANSVHVVLIRIENGAARTRLSFFRSRGQSEPASSFNELMSPIRAVAGTRDARADQAKQAVDQAANSHLFGKGCSLGDAECVQFDQVRLQLAPCDVAIPLGWSLSVKAQAEIRRQLGIGVDHSDSPCVKHIADLNAANFQQIMNFARQPSSYKPMPRRAYTSKDDF